MYFKQSGNIIILFVFFSPLKSSEAELALPSFTICASPFVNQTLVQELGLNISLWSTLKHQIDHFSDWPIKESLKDGDLWDRTTFGLEEIISEVTILGTKPNLVFKNILDELNGQILKIRVNI